MGALTSLVVAAAAGVQAAVGAHLTLHSPALLPHVLHHASGCLREKQWCYGVNWVVPLIRVAETTNCGMGRNKMP